MIDENRYSYDADWRMEVYDIEYLITHSIFDQTSTHKLQVVWLYKHESSRMEAELSVMK